MSGYPAQSYNRSTLNFGEALVGSQQRFAFYFLPKTRYIVKNYI
nr:MAG TPA: hypothetical protein [Caudoviricetes sp.]